MPDGSTATLDAADPVHPTFTPDLVGAYVVRLVVNDGFMDSARCAALPDAVCVPGSP